MESSSAFDTRAVLATGTRDAPGVAASSARNVAVTGYSSMGIGVRGQSNGSADGVEGMSPPVWAGCSRAALRRCTWCWRSPLDTPCPGCIYAGIC
jgi:hypothetical protein